MNEFQLHMLGTTSVPAYIAAFIFAAIGALIRLYLKSLKRNKYSQNTPPCFSWRFLIMDNFQQLMGGLLIAFLVFRFSNQFLIGELTMYYAAGLGLAFTEVAGWFEKFELKARK